MASSSEEAVLAEALNENRMHAYVCDFPSECS
jgi:hypothetical protein